MSRRQYIVLSQEKKVLLRCVSLGSVISTGIGFYLDSIISAAILIHPLHALHFISLQVRIIKIIQYVILIMSYYP